MHASFSMACPCLWAVSFLLAGTACHLVTPRTWHTEALSDRDMASWNARALLRTGTSASQTWPRLPTSTSGLPTSPSSLPSHGPLPKCSQNLKAPCLVFSRKPSLSPTAACSASHVPPQTLPEASGYHSGFTPGPTFIEVARNRGSLLPASSMCSFAPPWFGLTGALVLPGVGFRSVSRARQGA